MKNIHISISIVVYKTDKEVLHKAFSHMINSAQLFYDMVGGEIRLLLIDNFPFNGCPGFYQQILQDVFLGCSFINYEYIPSPDNKGYGHANNIAIRQSSSKYHLVMNPDIFMSKDALLNVFTYMEDNMPVGLLSPAMFGENGEQQKLCRLNPTLFDQFLRGVAPGFLKKIFKSRLARADRMDMDYSKIHYDLSALSGSFMFFRKSVLDDLGGFDEKFFMYLEDVDLSRRCLQISRTVYCPDVKVIHKWERASHESWKMRMAHIRSAITYWRKWGGIF